MIVRQILFIILFSAAFLYLTTFTARICFAGQNGKTYNHRLYTKNKNNLILKKMIIKEYFRKIPLKFRKYFHFNDFSFNVPCKNFKAYSTVIQINSPGFSGYNTAVIKLSDKNNGTLKGMDNVTFKTEIYAPVAVASRTIGKFQIIKLKDVKISYKNIPSLSGGYFLNPKKAAGREAKFFIAEGSALDAADTEKKRIINFGNPVNIVYDKYGLFLKTKGMALQAGALNSVIRVRNIESGAVIECIVVTGKTVAVK
jgi:flagella basal body P-ring formation protein FlgA